MYLDLLVLIVVFLNNVYRFHNLTEHQVAVGIVSLASCVLANVEYLAHK